MPVPTNTLVTADVKGMREDLSNVISDVTPEETVLFSNINRRKRKVTNRRFDWLQSELASPDDTNAHPEGEDLDPTADFEAVDQPDRLKGDGRQYSSWQGADLGSSERAYLNHCDEA